MQTTIQDNATDGAARAYRLGRAPMALVFALLLVPGMTAWHAAAAVEVHAFALFRDKAMLEIDGKQRLVRAGETTPEGVTLVQSDSEGATVSIGDETFALRLDGRISGGAAAAPARQVVRLVPGDFGHYFVDGQINGQPIRFLVDTGATSVAINKHVARRLGIEYRIEGTRGMVSTASGVAHAYRVLFDEVKVQALTLKRVTGTVIDGDAPTEALLGQSFLNRLDMHRQGQVLELRAR